MPESTPRAPDTKAPDAPVGGALSKPSTGGGKKDKEEKGGDSDDYEDDFDEADDKEGKNKGKQDLDDLDDWDMDDDDLEGDMNKKGGDAKDSKTGGDGKGVNAKEIADKKRRDLFFGGGQDGDDLNALEDLDMIKDADFDNKNEDKFNQVLSTSKENGGLLASIGLKKGDNDESIGDESQEEDPHKKSDLFDTSKDRGKATNNAGAKKDKISEDGEEFDLGFESSKKGTAGDAAKEDPTKGGAEGDGALSESNDLDMPEEQRKAIDEQFDKIYGEDAELRKALEKSDVNTFSVYEKFQIIEAYLQGGGASALQIELQDDDEDLEGMTEEDKQALNDQFDKLYAADPIL